MEKYIKDNIGEVLECIAVSARWAGREPGGIKLLAATKNRSIDEVLEAVEAGVRVVGENRVQELLEKAPALAGKVELHFIGHLQRNKARQVVGLVELIHSLDSLRLASEIDERAGRAGLAQKVLVQVNVAGEQSKSGVAPGELEGFIGEVGRLANLQAVGLSTIAPYAEDPQEARWVFAELRALGQAMGEKCEGFECRELSMGMTNDFEVAVEEGSTIVRVGTAIFGPRSYGI
jgi:pyridoxal phosphate enzyme (YggS family)